MKCARCGKETARSTYCKDCRGWAEKTSALLRTAGPDSELLAMHERMSKAAMARELKVSRAAVGQRLARAKRRQAARAENG